MAEQALPDGRQVMAPVVTQPNKRPLTGIEQAMEQRDWWRAEFDRVERENDRLWLALAVVAFVVFWAGWICGAVL